MPRGLENAPGGLLIEDVWFAEDITEGGELLHSYQRKHLVDHQIDVGAGTAKKLLRHFMSTEKCRYAAQGLGLPGLAHHAQDLHLSFHGESVTGFCFDGGCATAQKPGGVLLRDGKQSVFCCGPGAEGGGEDCSSLFG